MQIYHILGTDTDIGKTHSCCQIMQFLAQKGQRVTTLKPISSGQSPTEYGLINEDVERLIRASNCNLTVDQINPFNFRERLAPHIAAQLDHQSITAKMVDQQIKDTIKHLAVTDKLPPKYVLIEGVGGIIVPINETETYVDILNQFPQPIILVVGMKLGCLNHTLLSAENLAHNNLQLSGWIANQIDPNMEHYQANCDYLSRHLSAPLIATIPYHKSLVPTTYFKELFPCNNFL